MVIVGVASVVADGTSMAVSEVLSSGLSTAEERAWALGAACFAGFVGSGIVP